MNPKAVLFHVLNGDAGGVPGAAFGLIMALVLVYVPDTILLYIRLPLICSPPYQKVFQSQKFIPHLEPLSGMNPSKLKKCAFTM